MFAHIRASTGSPVQQTNCHPFRHGRWLWMHNGFIGGFDQVKRDLVLEVDPSLFSGIEGTTDTEVFFNLALTYGLADDPPAAVARAVGFIEATGRRHGVESPIQMTVATTDGESVWAFRYASTGDATFAVLQYRRQDAARSASGGRRCSARSPTKPARRLGAARVARRRVERGAAVELRRHPGRRRPPAAFHARLRLVSDALAGVGHQL